MKPTISQERTPEQKAAEVAIRQHAANPIRKRPENAIGSRSFGAILEVLSQFKAAREAQGISIADLAQRMGIETPELTNLESGKSLNPSLATLYKWAEALGQELDVRLSHVDRD